MSIWHDDETIQKLAEAEAALRFYASAPSNMLELFRLDGEACAVPDSDGDTVAMIGKRARAYFAKHPGGE